MKTETTEIKEHAWQSWQAAHDGQVVTLAILKDAFQSGFDRGGDAAVIEMYEAGARARAEKNGNL